MTKILKDQVQDLQDYAPKLMRLNRSMVANPDSVDASLIADFGRKGYGIGDSEGINQAIDFADKFTFTRASDKTAIDNASGLLVTVPANEPAFSWSSVFGGRKTLTIHEARTNLLTWSQVFDDVSWVKSETTITANAVNGLDGTLTADKLVESANNANHNINKTVTTVIGTTYTASIFAKAVERSKLRISRAGGAFAAWFDLTTGAFVNAAGTTANIKDFGNGWFLCEVSFPAVATSTSVNYEIQITGGTASESYLGDGTSGLYIWGAQLEVGSFATPYIKTEATTATRAADVCTIDDLSPWFNPSEGTFLFDSQMPPIATGSFDIGVVYDGTVNNGIFFNINNNQVRLIVRVSGVTILTLVAGTAAANQAIKLASSYADGVLKCSLNGAAVATGSATFPTGLSAFRIGSNTAGLGQLNSSINHIDYEPIAVSDAELIARSTI